MPELPEVETVVRGLQRSVIGLQITSLHVSRYSLRIPFPMEMIDFIVNGTIIKVYRLAKYIMVELDNNLVIIMHLGMSGKLTVAEFLEPQKHDHVTFSLSDGSRKFDMVFNDPRRFGLVTAVQNEALKEHVLLCKLGMEPFSPQFTAESLMKAIARRASPIKSVIMNNQIVVGVGNIYASESLFAARISPFRAANTLQLHECIQLVDCIREVLQAAIDSGGSTLRDYSQLNGESGYFQHKFNVYGRKQQPCYVCGNEIKSCNIAGRSTFYCEQCQ